MIRFKKIAIFGCKSTTLFLIRALVARHINVSCVITIDAAAGAKNEVADYCDLKDEVESKGIAVYTATQYSLRTKDDIEAINNMHLDIAFVSGWQRLIPEAILNGISTGVFGMHGSAMNLPLGRGRSPMNWSIIEGRKVFYTNLFKYDSGVDSGAVVDTFKFEIRDRDTGETMHYKNLLAMKYLIERNIDKLMEGTFSLAQQRTDIAPTFYPKRTPEDSLINWNQDIVAVERFIRGVSRPFNGAFTFAGGHRLTIWDAQIFDLSDFGYDNSTEGKIVAIFPGGKFLVKCFGGLLLVNEYNTDGAVSEDTILDNGGREINNFERNTMGYFDLV